MKLLPRLLAHLARPIKLVDFRLKLIEARLQIPLSDQDVRLVRKACAQTGGVRLGAYYHWYLQKLLVANTIRNSDKSRALALVNSIDHTDYASARCILESETGVLVAIPHHAHYVFSMIALAEHLRVYRKVYLFYGQPGTHKGNEIFDHLHRVIWGEDSNVDVIYDTRQGMAKAIRGLKSGEVVFIMPDVFQDEAATLALPFCGKPMSVMMGTATLARKTGCWILPVVSTRHGGGMGYRTEFGQRIHHVLEDEKTMSPDAIRIADYAVTRAMFGMYEKFMARDILYWQNMRQHLAQEGGFQALSRDELDEVAELLESDPALQPARLVVDLRTATA